LPPRALSKVEQAFWLLDRSTSFNGVNASFLKGPITADHVRQALAWVQARHEILRLAIREMSFVASDAPAPLRVEKEKRWQECEREEINGRYEEGELLWRAVWVERDQVLLISHQHVICDAQSAVIMTRDIVSALGQIVDGKKLERPASLELKPALTELLQPGFVEKFLAMNAFFFRNLVFHGIRPARKFHAQSVAFPERRLEVVNLHLDERETAALSQKCKQEQTSVQGGLCAAMLLAAAELLDCERPRWLASFSAISLHDRVDVHEDMGLYVSQVTTYHKVSKSTPLWELAREVKRDLQRAIKYGEQLVTIPMIGMFVPAGKKDPASKMAKKMDLASPATVGLSNIGKIDLPREVGKIELERFHLAVGPSVVSPLAACAATLHGKLSMNLVYVEPMVGRERAERLVARTRELIAR
jgi:hypothetical protein